MRKIIQIHKGECTDLMTAFVEASASDAFTSKTSVPVGASSGTAVKYILLAKVMTVEFSRALMMEESLYPPRCQPIVYMTLVSFGQIQC